MPYSATRAADLDYIRDPTTEQVHRYTFYDTAGLVVVSLGGLLWLRLPVRRERAAPIPAQFPSAPV
ncbi:hypothetical protein [Kitasatospora sp. NPDC093558]|uniref:hypothetical protein n=1 Tax=Kitasatospora sp. NPDC093558 TaxID=3155201 RepID=UPI003432B319